MPQKLGIFLVVLLLGQGLARAEHPGPAAWSVQGLKLAKRKSFESFAQSLNRWQASLKIEPNTLQSYGIDEKKLHPLGTLKQVDSSTTCPVNFARPLFWFKPAQTPEQTPYRRSLVCVVNLKNAFGGMVDLAPFDPGKPVVVSRFLASRGAAVLGDPEEEWDLPYKDQQGPPGVLMQTGSALEGQKGLVLSWIADDLGFLIIQWTDGGNMEADKRLAEAIKTQITPNHYKSPGLRAVHTLEGYLELAEDPSLPNATRFRALEYSRNFLKAPLSFKTYLEDFRTIFALDSLNFVFKKGLQDINPKQARSLAKLSRMMGRFPAMEADISSSVQLKIAIVTTNEAMTLPLSSRGKGKPNIAEIGKAILTSFGGELIDESSAGFLDVPAYEATFLSSFSKAYGRIWVFQRQKDLVFVTLLSKNPREIGRNSKGAEMVQFLEFDT